MVHFQFILIFVTIAAAACDAPANLVRLAPPARVDSVAFEISAIGGAGAGPASLVYGVAVVRCDETGFWTIVSDGTRSLPQRFTYGGALPGFETRAGPLPLLPGCYDILVSRARPLRFDIGADGSATARP